MHLAFQPPLFKTQTKTRQTKTQRQKTPKISSGKCSTASCHLVANIGGGNIGIKHCRWVALSPHAARLAAGGQVELHTVNSAGQQQRGSGRLPEPSEAARHSSHIHRQPLGPLHSARPPESTAQSQVMYCVPVADKINSKIGSTLGSTHLAHIIAHALRTLGAKKKQRSSLHVRSPGHLKRRFTLHIIIFN